MSGRIFENQRAKTNEIKNQERDAKGMGEHNSESKIEDEEMKGWESL